MLFVMIKFLMIHLRSFNRLLLVLSVVPMGLIGIVAAMLLGLIPIAVTIFWGSMVIAVMGGLLVVTVLTLIFLPALYVAWFRINQPAVRAKVLAHAHGS